MLWTCWRVVYRPCKASLCFPVISRESLVVWVIRVVPARVMVSPFRTHGGSVNVGLLNNSQAFPDSGVFWPSFGCNNLLVLDRGSRLDNQSSSSFYPISPVTRFHERGPFP